MMDEKQHVQIHNMLRTEIVISKMVIAHLSAALTWSTFGIDEVVHHFIKLLVVTWNLDNTPACRADATAPT